MNKRHTDYAFYIKFYGKEFLCNVEGTNVTIISDLPAESNIYEHLRNYIENEGFITEIDQKNGILDLFK
jgi:hypothetical protein